ncbi:hypothetical protein FR483_n157R [Paramecium bursaria Chlorella virus FR483]|uniref:Uncharacterized protein n157R n=1 Tax=Paramecium bursaria Chlorella virus FR483 TaxID=399781 RepID=A7J6L1_PBCVF|nr:hypothetical protein FR483_n157R [Paramecium bursaria Chlorella virus FR483]ABT15442.1 hypothetical protein FR483_n157R [Paramecium bursaria Chlorella virus FR483]
MAVGSRVSHLLCQQLLLLMFAVTSSGRTQTFLTLSPMSGATSAMWCSLEVMSQPADRSMSLATWCRPS